MGCPCGLAGRRHPHRTIPQEFLNPFYGVALAVQKLADTLQQSDIFRSIIPPSTAPLQGTDLTEFRLPEPQNMRRNLKINGNFADRPKRRRRFAVAPRLL